MQQKHWWILLGAAVILLLMLSGWILGLLVRQTPAPSPAVLIPNSTAPAASGESPLNLTATLPTPPTPPGPLAAHPVPLPPGAAVVAAADFNVDPPAPGTPRSAGYAIGISVDHAGNPDTGWAGPWQNMNAPELITIEKEAAFEGNAGLKFSSQGSENFMARELAAPVTGKFQIVAAVMSPEAMTTVVIIRPGDGNDNFGPQWSMMNGTFQVINGTGVNATPGPWVDTAIPFVPGSWYLVTITGDTSTHTWSLQVNDQTYKPDAPLRFRGTPSAIRQIDWFTSSTAYIDALKIIQLPQ